MRMGVGNVRRCIWNKRKRVPCVSGVLTYSSYPGPVSGHHQLSLVEHAGWWGCSEGGVVESQCVWGHSSGHPPLASPLIKVSE